MGFIEDVVSTLQRWAVGDGIRQTTETVVAAAVIYVIALWITRVGNKRFLGRNTVFDVLLAFILGSVLSRAINGNAPIGSTALAGFILVLMHWAFSSLAERSDRFGRMVKGRGEAVMRNGKMLPEQMNNHHITKNDIETAARQAGHETLDEVDAAYFERDGNVSIIAKQQVHVVEIDVQDGVQRVRIELAN